MYSPVNSEETNVEAPRRFSRLSVAGFVIASVLLGAAVVGVFTQDDKSEDSVHNLMLAARQVSIGREQALYDEAMEDEAGKQAAIAYATFVKSDDGIPTHGNLTGVYNEFADKVTKAQNATLEYQDEMKVVQGEIDFEKKEHKAQYEGLPDEVWDGQQ